MVDWEGKRDVISMGSLWGCGYTGPAAPSFHFDYSQASQASRRSAAGATATAAIRSWNGCRVRKSTGGCPLGHRHDHSNSSQPPSTFLGRFGWEAHPGSTNFAVIADKGVPACGVNIAIPGAAQQSSCGGGAGSGSSGTGTGAASSGSQGNDFGGFGNIGGFGSFFGGGGSANILDLLQNVATPQQPQQQPQQQPPAPKGGKAKAKPKALGGAEANRGRGRPPQDAKTWLGKFIREVTDGSATTEKLFGSGWHNHIKNVDNWLGVIAVSIEQETNEQETVELKQVKKLSESAKAVLSVYVRKGAASKVCPRVSYSDQAWLARGGTVEFRERLGRRPVPGATYYLHHQRTYSMCTNSSCTFSP